MPFWPQVFYTPDAYLTFSILFLYPLTKMHGLALFETADGQQDCSLQITHGSFLARLGKDGIVCDQQRAKPGMPYQQQEQEDDKCQPRWQNAGLRAQGYKTDWDCGGWGWGWLWLSGWQVPLCHTPVLGLGFALH